MTGSPSGARIILASSSAIRAAILKGAGVDFEAVSPGIDEGVIKRQAQDRGAGLEETAMMLAEAKAVAVSKTHAGTVIGSDQILEFQGQLFDKPADIHEARVRLNQLQGQTHSLINAIAAARDGAVVWRHIDRPQLKMRAMRAAEIDRYLGAAGAEILSSVGAYQVEGLGARLFEDIDGDYFAVLGLSLFPLLGFLRAGGALDY